VSNRKLKLSVSASYPLLLFFLNIKANMNPPPVHIPTLYEKMLASLMNHMTLELWRALPTYIQNDLWRNYYIEITMILSMGIISIFLFGRFRFFIYPSSSMHQYIGKSKRFATTNGICIALSDIHITVELESSPEKKISLITTSLVSPRTKKEVLLMSP
jgi:hypothetical protein